MKWILLITIKHIQLIENFKLCWTLNKEVSFPVSLLFPIISKENLQIKFTIFSYWFSLVKQMSQNTEKDKSWILNNF